MANLELKYFNASSERKIISAIISEPLLQPYYKELQVSVIAASRISESIFWTLVDNRDKLPYFKFEVLMKRLCKISTFKADYKCNIRSLQSSIIKDLARFDIDWYSADTEFRQSLKRRAPWPVNDDSESE